MNEEINETAMSRAFRAASVGKGSTAVSVDGQVFCFPTIFITFKKAKKYEEGFQMIKFNEYTPRGGWIKYRKRQEIKERVKAVGIVLLLLIAYGIVGYLETGV